MMEVGADPDSHRSDGSTYAHRCTDGAGRTHGCEHDAARCQTEPAAGRKKKQNPYYSTLHLAPQNGHALRCCATWCKRACASIVRVLVALEQTAAYVGKTQARLNATWHRRRYVCTCILSTAPPQKAEHDLTFTLSLVRHLLYLAVITIWKVSHCDPAVSIIVASCLSI